MSSAMPPAIERHGGGFDHIFESSLMQSTAKGNGII
jgi:hypothetical protein